MGRGGGPKRLVFISHSGTDTWVARQIAQAVAGCGADFFLDEADVELGADFERRIQEELMNAEELVVLLTPWALERPYVWVEIGAAWIREIPIVVLLLGLTAGQLQARPEIPVMVKSRNLLELNRIGDYLGQLRARVERSRSAQEGGEE